MSGNTPPNPLKGRSRLCRFGEARAALGPYDQEIVDMILGDHGDRIVGEALTTMVRNRIPDFPPVRRQTVNTHRLDECSCADLM